MRAGLPILFSIIIFGSLASAGQILYVHGKTNAAADSNIVAYIYDDPTAGTLVYSKTVLNAVKPDKTFDITLGDDGGLNLNFGAAYYLDLSVAGRDLDFNGGERKQFQAPLGKVGATFIDTNNSWAFSNGITVGGGFSNGGLTLSSNGIVYAQSLVFINDINAATITNVDLNGHYYPSIDATWDLGSPDYRFRKIYGFDVNFFDANIGTLRLNNPLGVSYGGTGATAFTTGTIPFSTGSALSYDLNLFWDNTNKRLGIGTMSPIGKLDVISQQGINLPTNVVATATSGLGNYFGTGGCYQYRLYSYKDIGGTTYFSRNYAESNLTCDVYDEGTWGTQVTFNYPSGVDGVRVLIYNQELGSNYNYYYDLNAGSFIDGDGTELNFIAGNTVTPSVSLSQLFINPANYSLINTEDFNGLNLIARQDLNVGNNIDVDKNAIINGNALVDGFAGFGTRNPVARLDVNGVILAQGTGGDVPVSGAGTRFMWIPNKGALRAGTVTGDMWDSSNIGQDSIALGRDTNATGQSSLSLGSSCKASGFKSVCIGDEGNANNTQSISIGGGTASGQGAVSIRGGTASGLQSVAISSGNSIGTGSVAINGATASGEQAVGIGLSSVAAGDHSFSSGSSAVSSGNYSVALGNNSTARGVSSVSIGENTDANSYNMIALGKHNISNNGYTPTAWISSDPILAVGIGTPDLKKNALTILKDGNMGILTAVPSYTLDVNGRARVLGDLNVTGATYMNTLAKLVPTSTPPIACDAAREGAVYYDSDVRALCDCNSTNWKRVSDDTTLCS